MQRFSFTVFLVATIAASLPAIAQYNKGAAREAACARERVPAVREVCLDKNLTRLDGELNEIYVSLSQNLSRRDFADLKRRQKSWLRQRNSCGRRYRCIESEYKDRIDVLARMLRNASDRGGERQPSSRCAVERRLRSLHSDLPTKITFRNRAESEEDSYKIYWLDFKGRRKLYATIYKGQTHRQQTFMTHPWVITSPLPGGGEICIGVYMPDAQARTVTLR